MSISYYYIEASLKDSKLFKNSFISPVMKLKNWRTMQKKCDIMYMESFKETFWVFVQKNRCVDFSMLI